MCDTMVVRGASTRQGQTLMAKNSDRHPNEPHIIIHQPQQQHTVGSKLRCTYIEVEQAPSTYAVLLLKPAWIWGAEMGANEFGLNIGNEAVFTREPVASVGLTGMDMLRLALERCRTSEEAVDFMVELLTRYGQGGNCGYGRRFLYHNSFLITDPGSAWVLETAGEYWAAAKVQSFKAISNRLTLRQEFDRAHPQLVEHAIQKGWCRAAQDFDFARCYTNPLITRFSGSRERLACSEQQLTEQQGNIEVSTLISTLRSHHPQDEAETLKGASVRSVCMHGGGLVGDHTTGSYVAALGTGTATYWVTGSSTPCLSTFKPLWLDVEEPVPYPENEVPSALEFWYQREQLNRAILQGGLPDLDAYIHRRDQLEQDWLQAASHLPPDENNRTARKELMARAWREESQLVSDALGALIQPGKRPGGYLYRSYWQRQTKALAKEQQHPRIFSSL